MPNRSDLSATPAATPHAQQPFQPVKPQHPKASRLPGGAQRPSLSFSTFSGCAAWCVGVGLSAGAWAADERAEWPGPTAAAAAQTQAPTPNPTPTELWSQGDWRRIEFRLNAAAGRDSNPLGVPAGPQRVPDDWVDAGLDVGLDVGLHGAGATRSRLQAQGSLTQRTFAQQTALNYRSHAAQLAWLGAGSAWDVNWQAQALAREQQTVSNFTVATLQAPDSANLQTRRLGLIRLSSGPERRLGAAGQIWRDTLQYSAASYAGQNATQDAVQGTLRWGDPEGALGPWALALIGRAMRLEQPQGAGVATAPQPWQASRRDAGLQVSWNPHPDWQAHLRWQLNREERDARLPSGTPGAPGTPGTETTRTQNFQTGAAYAQWRPSARWQLAASWLQVHGELELTEEPNSPLQAAGWVDPTRRADIATLSLRYRLSAKLSTQLQASHIRSALIDFEADSAPDETQTVRLDLAYQASPAWSAQCSGALEERTSRSPQASPFLRRTARCGLRWAWL